MGSFFSKKRVSRITDHDKAVLQLKMQRDNVKRQQARIENNLERDRNMAKKLISAGNRDRAKLLLRKKRYQEQLLTQTDQQLQNLEQLVQDLEYAKVEQQVVEGLKAGNVALKNINDALNIQDIEKILDETREGIEKQQEITELLSSVSATEEDELAVEDELNQLIAEESELLLITPPPPTHELIDDDVQYVMEMETATRMKRKLPAAEVEG